MLQEKIREATRLWTLATPIVSAYVAGTVRDFRLRDDVLQDIAIEAPKKVREQLVT